MRPPIMIPIGTRFGRLIILKQASQKSKTVTWICLCDCGIEVMVAGSNLRKRSNPTLSCGCLRRDRAKEKRTHGREPWRLFRIWAGMKVRCKDKRFHRYAGRGITVCPEWTENYELFRDWSFAHGYHDNLSIDRIDNNGNYEPSNCRWTTQKIQMRNTMINRAVIRSDGQHFATIVEAAEATPGSYEGTICSACGGRVKAHAGYGWAYANSQGRDGAIGNGEKG